MGLRSSEEGWEFFESEEILITFRPSSHDCKVVYETAQDPQTMRDLFKLLDFDIDDYKVDTIHIHSNSESRMHLRADYFDGIEEDDFTSISINGDFVFDRNTFSNLTNLYSLYIRLSHDRTSSWYVTNDEVPEERKKYNLHLPNPSKLERFELAKSHEIETLNDDIFDHQSNLIHIDLSYNKLKALPESLDVLMRANQVENLDLSFNNLQEIPEFYYSVDTLWSISLELNPITELPHSLLKRFARYRLNRDEESDLFISIESYTSQLPDYLQELHGYFSEREVQEKLTRYYNEIYREEI